MTKFVSKLAELLDGYKYSPTTFAINLNIFLDSDDISSYTVYKWLDGTLIPSLKEITSISNFFNISISQLLQSNYHKANKMSNTNNINHVIYRSKKTINKYNSVVKQHTTYNYPNIILANRIYNSGMTLISIANNVGKSTRSLRDYALYNTSVPADTAKCLVKLFKTTYTNLGLVYNPNTNRYDHVEVCEK